MSKHYVCPDCGEVSPNPRNCETEGIHLLGLPFVECSCADGLHLGVLKENY